MRLDNIPDITNTGFYTRQITLPPNVINCTDCTLQLIQVMTTNANPQPGDYYYSCSDIEITSADDTTPPPAVNNLQAGGADRHINLTWSNPSSDFYRVVVLQNTTPILDSLVNETEYAAGDVVNGSQVVYVGKAENFTATSLNNGTDYYFKVFTQNPRKNFDSGASGSATPMPTNTNTDPTINDKQGGGGSTVYGLLMLLATSLKRRFERLDSV